MIRALIVLADGFEEMEAVVPIDLMRRAGVEVTVAGLATINVTSKRGVRVQCDALLANCGRDFEALVLPGGLPGAQTLGESQEIQDRVQQQLSGGAAVAAICAAPAKVLGPLGVLSGRTWSGFPGTEGDGFGGQYTRAPVSVDGQLITGRAAGTATEFALALVARLCGEAAATTLAAEITWE